MSLSIKSHLGRQQACHSKTFLQAQEKVKSRITASYQDLDWVEEPRAGLTTGSTPQTVAQIRNDHGKLGQFLKTGIRKPASEELGSQVPEEVQRFTLISF